jgi:DNA-binding NarL/FixJ family response regulator
VRKLKLLFIENDSALRGLLGGMLAEAKGIELLATFARAEEVFGHGGIRTADAALIDFALDRDGLNGVEVGVALRSLNEHIGIVVYSQYSVKPLVNRVPQNMQAGWSFIEKNSDMAIDDYVKVLSETAAGKGNWQAVISESTDVRATGVSLLLALTARQRTIMDLAALGRSASEIAVDLGITYAYVRKELSRAYSVLLPNASSAVDLKTSAVLKYLEITRANDHSR